MHTYSLVEKLLFPKSKLNTNRIQESLTDKVVVITGATSGIGEQLARSITGIRLTLILTGRNSQKLHQLQEELSSDETTVWTHVADLRDERQLAGFVEFLLTFDSGLDVFVSNAGLSIHRPVLNSLNRPHDFDRTMAINYFAPVRLLLAVIPLLEKRKGQIINVSTINVLLPPMKHWAAYQASKAAFDTWLRAASPELKQLGIAVSSLYLPLVRTPMIAPTKAYDKMPAMSAEHVAAIIQRLIHTRKRVSKPWWLIWVGGFR